MRKFKVVALTSLFILSCAKKIDKTTEQLNQKTCSPESELMTAGIVGGSRVNQSDADSKKVVLTLIGSSTCTASAITPNVLITAAHCVNSFSKKSSAVAVFRTSVSCESGFDIRSDSMRITKVVAHPDYQPSFVGSEADIALVFLESSVPQGYPIYKIADPALVTQSSTIYFWGFGDVDFKKGGAGILRRTQVPREDFEIDEYAKKVKIDQSKGRGVCSGDSGGPGIVVQNGEYKILGINSFVSGEFDSTKCKDEGYLVLAKPFIPWIKSVLKQNNQELSK